MVWWRDGFERERGGEGKSKCMATSCLLRTKHMLSVCHWKYYLVAMWSSV